MSTPTDERAKHERGTTPGVVSRPRFEDYREKYATYFKLERRDGILQCRCTRREARHVRSAHS